MNVRCFISMQYPRRPEEGGRCPVAGVTVSSCHVGAGNQTKLRMPLIAESFL